MNTAAFAIEFVVTLEAMNRFFAARGEPELRRRAEDNGGIHNRFRTHEDGVHCRLSVINGQVEAWTKTVDAFGARVWTPLAAGHRHPSPTGWFIVDRGIAISIGLSRIFDMALDDTGSHDDVEVMSSEGVADSMTILDLGVL